LEGVAADVLAAARVQSFDFIAKETVEAGAFEVRSIDFAPKPEKAPKS
jgi:hypothetical protein